MQRRAEGGGSDYIEGGAAACLEAGLPQNMMAMLVSAGLPSRTAARAAIEATRPNFVTRSEVNDWLSSDEITALSKGENWPTPDTAAIWKRFREEALAAPIQRWTEEEWKLASKLPQWADPSRPARIYVDDEFGKVSVELPDYRSITDIKQGLSERRPSLLRVDYAADGQSATIKRMGPGRARWE